MLNSVLESAVHCALCIVHFTSAQSGHGGHSGPSLGFLPPLASRVLGSGIFGNVNYIPLLGASQLIRLFPAAALATCKINIKSLKRLARHEFAWRGPVRHGGGLYR
jgi:hypothetical protein